MITIGMPIHGPVDARTMLSLSATASELAKHGVPWSFDVVLQDSSVSRARNLIVTRFLASQSKRLLFIDSDMVWTVEDIYKLLSCDEDVVGAPYAKKSDQKGQVGVVYQNAEERGDLVEAERLGMGFTAISRTCLEKMTASYPETKFVVGDAYKSTNETGTFSHALFSETLRNEHFLIDDWTFCSRWKDIGGKIWMHTGIRPGHIGSYVYKL